MIWPIDGHSCCHVLPSNDIAVPGCLGGTGVAEDRNFFGSGKWARITATPRTWARDREPGLRVAALIGVVSTDPKREDSTMARTVIKPRTRQRQTIDQRPVLQLPIEV